MLGTRQTGLPQLRIASLPRDAGLLPMLRDMADSILKQRPDQAQRLINRWLSGRGEYGNV
jgi:ATP-dependent DNA helicase RecG